MRPVAQGVYYRHIGILCKVNDGFVGKRSRHNSLGIPAEHTCYVFDGFPLADTADVFGLDVDGIASEICHRYLKADSRSQAGLFKKHYECFAGQGQITVAAFVEPL